ncbi:NAD(P)-binding domain-containing protein [Nonomuraea sp. NPDC048882]|uniref:NAD(P)-binding domain-containing protein n=1 Tax=Nonomuraea sp. NPDC048882 TaxID=3154347 RepID=UPI0033E35C7A
MASVPELSAWPSMELLCSRELCHGTASFAQNSYSWSVSLRTRQRATTRWGETRSSAVQLDHDALPLRQRTHPQHAISGAFRGRGRDRGRDRCGGTGARVEVVQPGASGFLVRLAGGQELTAFAVVAASGSFGRPHRPALPGLDAFARPVLHVADYRSPASLPGEHVVVVGAGNSAVQVAYEPAAERRVTLAGRAPIRFVEQRPLGRDLHFWFRVTGFDRLPLARADAPPAAPVLDDGRYRRALRERRYVRRAMFTRLDGDQVVWSDGRRERVDAVLLATGYRPDPPYLAETGALGADGRPRQRRGLSLTHPGLGYLGLEWQRTPSSNTLRGVGADARHVVAALVRHLRVSSSPS